MFRREPFRRACQRTSSSPLATLLQIYGKESSAIPPMLDITLFNRVQPLTALRLNARSFTAIARLGL